jgi:hypothetical protein
MKSNKAPRLNGFSAGFFLKAWPIIRMDVVEAMQSFFSSSMLLK